MASDDAARSAALRLLNTWEEQQQPFEELVAAIDTALSDGRDQRFARQLALGVLCWRKRLDWIIGHFCRRPVDKLDSTVRNILRLGVYQTTFMDRVPERAAVHTSVELAKRHGALHASGLINAVLRNLQRQPGRITYPDIKVDPVRHLALYHSHPEWLVQRWRKRWGQESASLLLEANNRPSDLWLRLNPLRTDAPSLCAELDLDPGPAGYYRALTPSQIFRSHAYSEGHFQIQDPSAGLAVALLDPQPEENILDLCSAPGGKTTQIAECMRDTGMVLAADLSPQRLLRVRENAQRLHLNNIRLVALDARTLGPTLFDRVLVDAPCSGTGIIGRHPDARWHKEADQLAPLAARQTEILARAFTYLRPGGVLVYSTCSIEPEENEDIVETFLELDATAQLEEASDHLPDDDRAQRYVQTRPGQHIGDGSFSARIRKKIP
jgi:16S rRNA (cytosine967-C5)-methyltransferase